MDSSTDKSFNFHSIFLKVDNFFLASHFLCSFSHKKNSIDFALVSFAIPLFYHGEGYFLSSFKTDITMEKFPSHQFHIATGYIRNRYIKRKKYFLYKSSLTPDRVFDQNENEIFIRIFFLIIFGVCEINICRLYYILRFPRKKQMLSSFLGEKLILRFFPVISMIQKSFCNPLWVEIDNKLHCEFDVK